MKLDQIAASLKLSGISKDGTYFDIDMEKLDALTHGEYIRILFRHNGETSLTFLSDDETNHPNHDKELHIKGIADAWQLYKFAQDNSIR